MIKNSQLSKGGERQAGLWANWLTFKAGYFDSLCITLFLITFKFQQTITHHFIRSPSFATHSSLSSVTAATRDSACCICIHFNKFFILSQGNACLLCA